MVRGAARQRLPRTGPASRCGEGRSGGGAGGRARAGRRRAGGREGERGGGGGGGAPLTAVSPPQSSRPSGEAVPQAEAQVRRERAARQVRVGAAGAVRSIPPPPSASGGLLPAAGPALGAF